MENKTLNIISIIVVILLLIFGWFYVFKYGGINKEKEDMINSELEQEGQNIIDETCLEFPDSPICQ